MAGALAAVRAGFAVLPLDATDPSEDVPWQFFRMVPTHPNGVRYATRNCEVIYRQWNRFPHRNPGAATGRWHGIMGVGSDYLQLADESWDRYATIFGPLPAAPTIEYVRDKNVRLFQTPHFDIGSSVDVAGAGIAFFCDGGYVLLPPGNGGACWDTTWAGGGCKLPRLPFCPAWVALLASLSHQHRKSEERLHAIANEINQRFLRRELTQNEILFIIECVAGGAMQRPRISIGAI